MALNFDNKIPEWKNEGAEPSEDLKTKGFKGGYKPPAAVFNWFWCLVQKCINELQTLLKDHAEDTNNPHGTTKTHVGLGNADNTADSDKKVLSATKLTTARKINDVAFNGTKDITVTANPTLNKLAEGTDLNDVKAIGFYKAGNESITNTPSGVGSFSLVVSGIGGAGYVQELYDFNTRAKYIRHTTSATAWAGWIKLAVNSDVESINTELAKTLKSQGTVISEDTKWTQLEQGIYEVALDNGWSDTNTTTPNNYNSNIPSDGALIVFKAINSESSASKIVQIYVPIDNGLIVRRTRQFTGTWSSWLPITYGHTHDLASDDLTGRLPLTKLPVGLDDYILTGVTGGSPVWRSPLYVTKRFSLNDINIAGTTNTVSNLKKGDVITLAEYTYKPTDLGTFTTVIVQMVYKATAGATVWNKATLAFDAEFGTNNGNSVEKSLNNMRIKSYTNNALTDMFESVRLFTLNSVGFALKLNCDAYNAKISITVLNLPYISEYAAVNYAVFTPKTEIIERDGVGYVSHYYCEYPLRGIDKIVKNTYVLDNTNTSITAGTTTLKQGEVVALYN